jgi:DNA gyrase subunit A
MARMHALRDVRDGLDAAGRRVLFRLGDKYVRCSKVVDDEEEYDALVELAQTHVSRYPLVQGRGNFGSMDSDPPADAEYTEARLAPLAHELPRFPNLLVNGAPGIPPHNLREVAAGKVLGPDYPTGGVIPDPASLRSIYESGLGAFRLRARAHLDDDAIMVTELPYGVSKGGDEGVIRAIVGLVNGRELAGIDDLQDRSGRDGMRLWIGLKPGTDAGALLADLYARDLLEVTIDVDLTALVDGVPKRLTLPDLLVGDDLQRIAERFGDARRTTLGDARA